MISYSDKVDSLSQMGGSGLRVAMPKPFETTMSVLMVTGKVVTLIFDLLSAPETE